MNFKEQLVKGIICAEGYLFEMERRGYLQAGPFVPEVVLNNPRAVMQLHAEFVDAGSDVVQAFTYYGDSVHLNTIGRHDDYEALNRNALYLARVVADSKDVLMAGNICNIWDFEKPEEPSLAQVAEIWAEQTKWAKEEGADFIIAETLHNMAEGRLAVEVIKSFNIPAVITFSAHKMRSDDGYTWREVCRTAAEMGADVVGMNCARGPQTMLPILKEIVKDCLVPVAALPVPYRTTRKEPNFFSLTYKGDKMFPVKLERFLMDRDEVAQITRQLIDIGIKYFGLCCGAQAYHIRAMAEALGRSPVAGKFSHDMSPEATRISLRKWIND